MRLSCGQCAWCRWVKTGQWAIRCTHEAEQYKQNCFIDLTYRPADLPKNASLVKKDAQEFIKNIRNQNRGKTIRYFLAGEYGTATAKNNWVARPHYHILLFGHDFTDKKRHKKSQLGHTLYRSAMLEKAWTKGYSDVGELNVDTARYAAGYIRKKINGDRAAEHYGERIPEFAIMSLKPGLGFDWYEKNKQWLFKPNEDLIRHAGKSYSVPRYYEKLYEAENPEGYEILKEARRNRTPEQRRRRFCVETLPEDLEDEKC